MVHSRFLSALDDPPSGGDQRGFSLLEAVVGTFISVLAIVGLAHTFGLGRGMVDRFEIARAALGTAQRRMEILTAGPPASLIADSDNTGAFYFHGATIGSERWTVKGVDEGIDSLGDGDLDQNPNDLRQVTVKVYWGAGGASDSIQLVRMFPAG